MKKNPEVDLYFQDGCGRCTLYKTAECKVNKWHQELQLLREILLRSELDEELKWKQPCYTLNGKNVILISAFTDNCVLSFFKGSLLTDDSNILEKPGENSKVARVIRFQNIEKIQKLEKTIEQYIEQAIKIEKSGKKIVKSTTETEEFPVELAEKLASDIDYKNAFESLTNGRKRSYLLYFNSAKQSKTKIDRIERAKEKVISGKGWNEY